MRRPYLFLLLIYCGCIDKTNISTLHINLINDNRSIKLSGLNYAILQDIERDTIDAKWQSLFPIYRMPADTDMKDYQRTQPGLYQVKDNSVVFTPDTPFIKNKVYFVRYYHYTVGSSVTDFMAGKNKPGIIHYRDLIFKP